MKIAIVGASGAVGQELMDVLAKSGLVKVDELRLFGSERSEGRVYKFQDRDIKVQRLRHEPEDFADIDIAFVSAGASVSREFADVITASGHTWMIDNSSAFRMDENIPLVVPEINPEDIHMADKHHIIANPNCTTIQMVVALNPIHRLSPIKRVHVATYQAASGAGAAAMHELEVQHADIAAGREPKAERFCTQLAYNVIPHIDTFTDNGYTREEMKMHNETKKIMHAPGLEVSATCVRVPVMRAHSEAIWVETAQPVSLEAAREAFASAPGVVLVDGREACGYPMPLGLSGCDPVYVGRVRLDLANPCGLSFWTVSDQIRKGAALNAVQIASLL